MSKVKFEDFTIKVLAAMDSKLVAALEECAGEIESQTKRNSRVAPGGGKTKNSFKHKVVDSELTAYIGSDEENAIWEEFGTGEHALKGDGRKGYWVYVKGSDGNSKKTGKSYSLKEAKRVMAILRSKGLEAYYTSGKKPSRAFWKAYTSLKNKIINYLQNSLKGL